MWAALVALEAAVAALAMGLMTQDPGVPAVTGETEDGEARALAVAGG